MDDNEVRVCPVCGKPRFKMIDFPLLDGSGGTEPREIRVMCDCEVKKRQEQEEKEKREREIALIHDLRKLSLIDERLSGVNFSNCTVDDNNRKVIGIARKYVENFDEMYRDCQGLLFFGDVGTGKSYIAAAIANELMNRLVPVVMTSFVRILQEMQNIDIDCTEFIRKLNNAKLLVIDDLGAERGTDYALERVYEVIDSRYRSNKPVLLTTNLQYKAMQECVDIRYSRIYDRVFEMCYPVKFTGKSWRKRDAIERFDRLTELFSECS